MGTRVGTTRGLVLLVGAFSMAVVGVLAALRYRRARRLASARKKPPASWEEIEALREASRERRVARKEAKKKVAWLEASARAPVDKGVKKKERSLEDMADINAHNAWDAVPWDLELEARTQTEARAKPAAPAHEVRALCANSDRMWDAFYRQNLLAYKHRRYLHAEFPELAALAERGSSDEARAAPPLVLEIGCGAGNAALPLLAQFPRLHVFACDVSASAVRLLTEHPGFPPERCRAAVWDVASPGRDGASPGAFPDGLRPGSVDVALLVFVLSALPPAAFRLAACNILACLRPGGLLLFRDYGSNDAKQRKFNASGTKLGEGWYARRNGTMVFFFEPAQLDALFTECGFELAPAARPPDAQSGREGISASGPAAEEAEPARASAGGAAESAPGARFDKVLMVNRKSGERLWRVWVSGRYRKPLTR